MPEAVLKMDCGTVPQLLKMLLNSDTERNLSEDYALPLGTSGMPKIQAWKMRRNEGTRLQGPCQDGTQGMAPLGAHLEDWMLLLTPAT